jgi:hypothetical protein
MEQYNIRTTAIISAFPGTGKTHFFQNKNSCD